MSDLSERTATVLQEAGLSLEDTPDFSDEELLAVSGIGEKVLAEIRAAQAEDAAGIPAEAAEEVPDDASEPEPEESESSETEPEDAAETPPAPPAGCTCTGQKFKVTRTRIRKGRLERYCEKCGAIKE